MNILDLFSRASGANADDYESILFPAAHTRELLVLKRDAETARGTYKQLQMWRFVNEKLPIVRGRQANLDTRHATRLYVRVGPKQPDIKVGAAHPLGRLVAVWPIPPEHLYRFCELQDQATDPLGEYDLWTFVHRLFPETDTLDTPAFALVTVPEFQGVIRFERVEIAKGSTYPEGIQA